MSDDLNQEILPINIEDELKNSYLDYAMSVIVGRALPDVRDGLKPVHRRVLYAMSVLRNDWNKAYKKSARVVGDVIGKYHPHGDTAVYDTIVRMAQDFSLRYCLVDGQGNFGSVDGDSAAAMRYTEIRMKKIAHQIISDLEKETVNFSPNYDESETIPDVMPTRIPNLLINGSSGIAVGMATNIPSHNLNEIVSATIALIDNKDLTISDLMEYIPGPDFPTKGQINGVKGILDAYNTGRGKIYIRSKSHIEERSSDKENIVVTEIPYQVNKARLIEKIAELVKLKTLEGIIGLRDESDKDGMRIVIELKKGEIADVILNNLYKQTQMQTVFGINMIALDKGQPRLFNLKQVLEAFIDHRKEVVTRRTIFELKKAKIRAHILEGLAIALVNIDKLIVMIKSSKTPNDAKIAIMQEDWQLGEIAKMLEKTQEGATIPDDLVGEFGARENGIYKLSSEQTQAILDLRLHKLTSLEHDKIHSEYSELLEIIKALLHILNSRQRLMEVIKEELEKVKDEFSDKRQTEICAASHDIDIEDMITKEDVVVTLSNQGYVKYQILADYQAQRRGGRGKSAANIKEEDFLEKLIIANTHDTILCFSTFGKVYWLKVYKLPLVQRTARGKPIVNLLSLDEGERITAILPVKEYRDDQYIIFATKNGTIKKTTLSLYSRPMITGIRAINLQEGNLLVSALLTDGKQDIMLFSNTGKAVRFKEEAIRATGRTAIGVRGIRLKEGQELVSMIVPDSNGKILTVTENGFGKRTSIEEYAQKGRGIQGVISIKVSERNGSVIGAVEVQDDDEIMLITNGGTLVRTRVNEIADVGRNTQGVRLIRTTSGEKLVAVQKIAKVDDDLLEDQEQMESQAEVNKDKEGI